jgi:hypothetical protein
MCRLLGDTSSRYCGSETHADCKSSPLCRDQGRCLLAPTERGGNGPCTTATLRDVQRLPLTEAVHKLRGELVVLVDSRLKPKALEDGYAPTGNEPFVASAVQLRTREGAVLSELTFYPAVDVRARRLGSGTDTFLATEHIACESGRWCGWRTVFFEIRDQRLVRLSAEGIGGRRQVEATASFAARWMLTPASRRGAGQLIVQREAPDRDPSATFVETRFSFADQGWHFTERDLARDDRALRQAGPWLGSLDD